VGNKITAHLKRVYDSGPIFAIEAVDQQRPYQWLYSALARLFWQVACEQLRRQQVWQPEAGAFAAAGLFALP